MNPNPSDDYADYVEIFEAPPTPRTPEDVKRQLEQDRAELSSAALALRDKMAVGARVTEWVQGHIGVTLAAMFVLGFVLGHRR